MTAHYVDNKKLYEEMVRYRASVKQSQQDNKEKPRVPDYIGQCILLIANRLSLKPNFVNYSYREEMVSDGIENCICYVDNFDPEKSDNPFAYFTQIIYFAFLRRIQKEKKHLYIKHKALENSLIHNTLVDYEGDDGDHTVSFDFDTSNISDFIKSFEDNLDKKRVKRKAGIEKFLDDEEVDGQTRDQ